MEPTLGGWLTAWSWRADVLIALIGLGTAFVIGWWRLRKGAARVALSWRFAAYLAGLASLSLALLSPIAALGSQLFLMHMIQHEMLIMVGPPLLLLADPLPVLLWSLPRNLRLGVRHPLARGALIRRILCHATWMPVAGGIYVVNLWVWHIPAAYKAALRNYLLHDLGHLAFFGTAILFWWPIINPAPRLHGDIAYGFRILYILAATFPTVALGFTIAVTDRLLYPHYAAGPRLWGLSPLDDQAFGGAIMSEGGMMLLIPLLVLINQWFNEEERRSRLRESMAMRVGQAAQ
jgi:cytochrome c oxidase assembly factor CtaG